MGGKRDQEADRGGIERMILAELHNALAKTGIKVVYQETLEKLSPPYIVYFEDSAAPITANGVVAAVVSDVEIHLVTKPRDHNLEEKIENALAGLSITWEKSLQRDSRQEIFDTAYIVTIVTGKE